MRIEVFPMGVFQVNSYLLTCDATGEVVVVDPGDEPQILISRLAERGVKPVAILNTHGHIDHVAGNSAVRNEYDVPIYMNREDLFLIETFQDQAQMFGISHLTPPPDPDRELVAGEAFRFGETRLDIVATPGHSPGSVSLLHGGDAISGDVVFAGSIGRTDLPRADAATLFGTLDDVVLSWPDETVLHPGHGPSTTVGRERASNPFFRPELRAQFLG